MKCPFENEKRKGIMICDAHGISLKDGIKECPAEYYNKCKDCSPISWKEKDKLRYF